MHSLSPQCTAELPLLRRKCKAQACRLTNRARLDGFKPVRLLTVSKKNKRAGVDDLSSVYAKRCSFYSPLEEIFLRPNPKNMPDNPALQKAHEGAELLTKIRKGDFCIALHEGGNSFTSRQFAQLILGASETHDAIAIIIGGPYGLSEPVLSRADVVLSVSPMTLNHRVARVLLLEQLYRAHTIIKNQRYHHE